MSEKKRAYEAALKPPTQNDARVLFIAMDYIEELEQQVEAARREEFEAAKKRVSYAHEIEDEYKTYADYAKSREGK